MNDSIIIKGAKEHNLKNINIEIPKDKLVVIKLLQKIHVQQLEQLQKFTIIFVYYMQELVFHIAQTVERKLKSRH